MITTITNDKLTGFKKENRRNNIVHILNKTCTNDDDSRAVQVQIFNAFISL